MRSIEPGISRFRVWSFGPSRNDKGENLEDGVVQPTRPNPASADQACCRQYAVAGFDGARAKPGAARKRVGADLLARYDGRAAGYRFRPRSRRRTQRRKAFRQGGARAAAARARDRRRWPVYGRYDRTELEQGSQHSAAT